ncbi:MAG: 3-dehydroquinate synthase [Bacteroidetes bacterium]|nr:3-dehydroquinate synthase [Bacteroidota bacterium]
MNPLFSQPAASLYFGSLSETGFEKILQQQYPHSRFVLLTDENVAEHWSEFMVTGFEILSRAEIIVLPAGEENKNLEICQSVWEALSEYEIGRGDVIINIGGGMITDLGGFVASTFKRGVRFINIPTSLLAQVDASVGGKTGVDLGPFKNQVGLFAEPDLVFLDPGFLETLPQNQIRSGFAEMLKHGLVADAAYWKKLKTVKPENTAEIVPYIEQSVRLKKAIVEQDYAETGLRKTLNFGHTIGHALEGYFLNKENPLLHGYAVGLGIIAESYISLKKGLLSEVEFNEIEAVCKTHFGESLAEKPIAEELLKLMQNDKKNAGGKINFSLLKGIGNCVFDQQVERGLILESLQYLNA